MNQQNQTLNQTSDLYDHINSEEEIIWEGGPKPDFKINWYVTLNSILGILLIFPKSSLPIYFLLLFLCVPLLIPWLLHNFLQKDSITYTYYVITNKYIYFQICNEGTVTYHSIPLSDICGFVINTFSNNGKGIIFLNHKITMFKSYYNTHFLRKKKTLI